MAIAAPLIPKPKKYIKIRSRVALSRFPAPANRKKVLKKKHTTFYSEKIQLYANKKAIL